MKKWVCPVCGYVYEGENPPAECPVCHVSGDKFLLQSEEKSWAAEHVEMMGLIGMGNNPMVGATVACAVAAAQANA